MQYSGVSEVLDAHTTAGLVVPRCQPRVLACPMHASKFQLMRLREAGLLERPRGGHRGERVLAAKERVRTLVIRVDD